MDTNRIIARNIADAIKCSGKNQAQVARELQVHKTLISDYIAARSMPSLPTLIRLCAVLDCTYEDILGRLD